MSAIDGKITLKKGVIPAHTHRYTLSIKVITCHSDEEEQALIKEELTSFFAILLRVDNKTIIPPFLELDQNDAKTLDLSASYTPEAVDSFTTLSILAVVMQLNGNLSLCYLV